MANSYFNFKLFSVSQLNSPFKVGTDGVLLGAWATVPGSGPVLDIGTGTGLLALMIAQRCKSGIIAIEPDLPASIEADSNVKKSKWSSRITVINSTLQHYKLSATDSFDLIISNPPFFSNSLLNSDERISRSRHDLTLKPEDILEAAVSLLSEKGILSMIMPYVEGTLFIATASEYGLYCNRITKVKATHTKPVGRLLMEFSKKKLNLVSGFLTIESSRHKYTQEYMELTKDFYLQF